MVISLSNIIEYHLCTGNNLPFFRRIIFNTNNIIIYIYHLPHSSLPGDNTVEGDGSVATVTVVSSASLRGACIFVEDGLDGTAFTINTILTHKPFSQSLSLNADDLLDIIIAVCMAAFNFLRALNLLRPAIVSCLCITDATLSRF